MTANTKTAITCAMVALLGFARPGHTEHLGVFGFVLGQPLNLDECTYRVIGGSKSYIYPAPKTCTEQAHAIQGYGQPSRRILFSKEECPIFVNNCQMIALEIDGRLAGIEFFTQGSIAQETTMNALVRKYGPPTSSSRFPVQNPGGASFESIEAQWKFETLSVSFSGTYQRIDTGNVTIDLPSATELRRKWLESDRIRE
jgi:hypothetical protein